MQSSIKAVPKQSPLQSISLLARWAELPPEHWLQSSTIAVPNQSSLQSILKSNWSNISEQSASSEPQATSGRESSSEIITSLKEIINDWLKLFWLGENWIEANRTPSGLAEISSPEIE